MKNLFKKCNCFLCNSERKADMITEAINENVGNSYESELLKQANESVFEREIWNEAIEAAAKIADDADEIAAQDIRRLKK